MKWKVMKTFGLLPSDPQIQNMTDVQWNFCFLNVIRDMEEEEESWKSRMKYVGMFIDKDAVVSMIEFEQKEKGKMVNKNREQSSEVYSSSEFEMELNKAMNGNNGDCFIELPDQDDIRGNPNMSSDEFVDHCVGNIDLFNQYQESLLNKGNEFIEKYKEEIENDLDIIEFDS